MGMTIEELVAENDKLKRQLAYESTALTMMKADYNARLKADMVALLGKIRAEIIELEGDCRLSIDEHPSCKQCTNYVFGTIYEILGKCRAEMEGKE